MSKSKCRIDAPWLKYYDEQCLHIKYPDCSLYELVKQTSNKYPDYPAYIYFNKKTKYKDFIKKVNILAKALKGLGIKENEIIMISLPNCPEMLIAFYAINAIGAISCMIHPLSSEGEFNTFLNDTGARFAITMDLFWEKFSKAKNSSKLQKLILVTTKDSIGLIRGIGFSLTAGRKINKYNNIDWIITWKNLFNSPNKYSWNYLVNKQSSEAAVILYSGGTTGKPKGIVLTNRNFNCLYKQFVNVNTTTIPGDTIIAAMPNFHGFGLGLTIHSALARGGCCILMPRFTAKTYLKTFIKYKCVVIAGVPTLYEAILSAAGEKKYNLRFLKGVYSGGDSLPDELRERLNNFLKKNNSNIRVSEGYGLTECVTASCVTPDGHERKGSIGIPFPDMHYKIVDVKTKEDLPYGEKGEICIAGPTLMKEYLNCEDETKQALQKHKDGNIWLHTGDLGYMDSDGYVYFVQRLKRIIVSSGYNIYPSQLEEVFDAHEFVKQSCVIGVFDKYKIQRLKVFIVLNYGVVPSKETTECIMDYAKKNIAKYALPSKIEYRDSLPTTLVGKVDYKKLEDEANLS